MVKIEEVKNKDYDNTYGICISQPKKNTYILYVGNKKQHTNDDINWLNLMSSLVLDYKNGRYKRIPVKTILYTVPTIYYFIKPKRKLHEKIPIVKHIKPVFFLTKSIKSFREDLLKYKSWKDSQKKEIVEL